MHAADFKLKCAYLWLGGGLALQRWGNSDAVASHCHTSIAVRFAGSLKGKAFIRQRVLQWQEAWKRENIREYIHTTIVGSIIASSQMYRCISFAGSCPWCCAIVGISTWQAHRSACAKHNPEIPPTKTQDEGRLEAGLSARTWGILHSCKSMCQDVPSPTRMHRMHLWQEQSWCQMSFSWPQTWRGLAWFLCYILFSVPNRQRNSKVWALRL